MIINMCFGTRDLEKAGRFYDGIAAALGVARTNTPERSIYYASSGAGITFAFVPYRFDHYQHLELQAAFFIPLTRAMTLHWATLCAMSFSVNTCRPRFMACTAIGACK